MEGVKLGALATAGCLMGMDNAGFAAMEATLGAFVGRGTTDESTGASEPPGFWIVPLITGRMAGAKVGLDVPLTTEGELFGIKLGIVMPAVDGGRA
jgi:hypothetical protein